MYSVQIWDETHQVWFSELERDDLTYCKGYLHAMSEWRMGGGKYRIQDLKNDKTVEQYIQ